MTTTRTVLTLTKNFNYHYCEQEKASIATYRDGLIVGEWWMVEAPTNQGIFDIHGAIFYIPTAWCQGSPIYLRTLIIITLVPHWRLYIY